MNPRVYALDLEYNQPSGKIIQIGIVIGNLHQGNIIEEIELNINPYEAINPFITELTGITQVMVDRGVDLESAYKEINKRLIQSRACKSPVVWGNGDLKTLKSQVKGFEGSTIHSTHRELDIKTVHQFLSLSQGYSMRGGLEKAMLKYGLRFSGTPHRALDDARSTFFLAYYFHKLLKDLKHE